MARWNPPGDLPWAPLPIEREDLQREGWGVEFDDPPAGPAPTRVPYPREFTPDEWERMDEHWREESVTPTVRTPSEMEPTVGDDLYGRSLHGSSRFTRDEICRGYRRL